MISSNTIEQVKRIPIKDVVGRYVPVKQSGKDFKCSCVFHNEKSASMVLFPKTDTYKCFGCQNGGDQITFIEKYCSLEFHEAVETLCENHGIVCEYEDSDQAKLHQAAREQKKTAITLLQELCLAYQAAHTDVSYTYLQQRGFSKKDVETFGYGFAPKACRLAQVVFQKYPAIGRDLGYIKEGEDGSQYDFFRNRIIIPIRSKDGKVIAFSGRALDDNDGAKYINSAASNIYNKSHALYGIDRALQSIRKSGEVCITEGYFDVDMAFLRGVDNIVSQCGTSITQDHISEAARCGARTFIFIPDLDAITVEKLEAGVTADKRPGIKSAIEGVKLVTSMGYEAKVIELPQENIMSKVDLHSFYLDHPEFAVEIS